MTTHANRGFLAALRRALAALDAGFCKLNRIRYDAPWRAGEARRC